MQFFQHYTLYVMCTFHYTLKLPNGRGENHKIVLIESSNYYSFCRTHIDGGNNKESKLFANCYQNSLSLAIDNNCILIAFPNISAGVYGFPKEPVAKIAIRKGKPFLFSNKLITKVFFCCFDSEN